MTATAIRPASAFQIKALEKYGIDASTMTYDDAYIVLGEQFAKAKAEKKTATPKATPKKAKAKTQQKTTPAKTKENDNMVYTIEVCTNTAKGEWKHRATIEAGSKNAALRQYGIRGTRPRLGEATSKSGKRFRAIAA